MPTAKDPFVSIDAAALASVAGGASRVTARSGSSDQLTAMLTQITNSIQALASHNNQSDPSQMMMMMMMMGGMGGGGGGGGSVAAPVAAPPQAINVSTGVSGGGGGWGGWGGGGGCGGGGKGW